MPDRVLAAIRGQPWAIEPEYLAAIEAVAMRLMTAPALEALRLDGHAERHDLLLGAVAAMGVRLEGSRGATVRDGVAALPIFGPIFPRAQSMSLSSGGTSLDMLAADFRVGVASSAVSQILLVVDSPGGLVSGVAEFADLVRSSAKPVTAFVAGSGSSAAYWIASQASELVVSSTALVGNIGIVVSASTQEAPDQNGRRAVEIVSSNAVNKRPDLATEEGRAVIRAELDRVERVFIGDVATGRKVSRDVVLQDFGRGGSLVGAAAVKAGMADRVDTLEATLLRLARASTPAQSGQRRALAERELEVRHRRAGVS